MKNNLSNFNDNILNLDQLSSKQISLPGVTKGYSSTDSDELTVPIYGQFSSASTYVLMLSNQSNYSIEYTNQTGSQTSQMTCLPGKSLNCWIAGDTSYSGPFSKFINIVAPNEYFQIGTIQVKASQKGSIYVPNQLNVPFIIINGQTPITIAQYFSNVPNNNGSVVWDYSSFSGISTSAFTNFPNTYKYVMDCYNGKATYSQVGLINALTSEVNSQGEPLVKLQNINISNNQYEFYQKSNFQQGNSSEYTSVQLSQGNNNNSWIIAQFCSTQWAAGPQSFWNGPTGLDQAYKFSDQFQTTNISTPNGFLQSWMGCFNDSVNMYYPDNNQDGIYNITPMVSGPDGLVNNWVNAALTNTSNPYSTTNGSTPITNISFTDWVIEANQSYYNNPQYVYANSGKSYFQKFQTSYNINPVYINYGIPLSDWNDFFPTSSSNQSIFMFTQGTPLFTADVIGEWYFSLYWYSDNGQYIYSLPVQPRQIWPGLIFQQYWLNYVSNTTDDLVNIYMGSIPSNNQITVPVIEVTITSNKLIRLHQANDKSEFDEMVDTYTKLASIINSTIFSQHNIKLMFQPSLSQLMSQFPSLLPNQGQSFNQANGVFIYSTFALMAIKNYNLTSFLTNIVKGYPFSSIPPFIEVLLTQISSVNNSVDLSNFTPDILNTSIDVFFTTPSPSKVNFDENNNPVDSTLSDMSLSEIKTVQRFLSEGIALSMFTSQAVQFISHIHSVNSVSDLKTLQSQWESITSNWNKAGLNSTTPSEHYLFLQNLDSLPKSLQAEIDNINQIVSSAFRLSDSQARTKARLQQALYNQHHSRSNAISILISKLGDDLLHENPWKVLGSVIKGSIITYTKLELSVVKLIAKMTIRIMAGISTIVSPGGLIESIFNDINKYLPDDMANYPYLTQFFPSSLNITNVFSTVPMVMGSFPSLTIINPFVNNNQFSLITYQLPVTKFSQNQSGSWDLSIMLNNSNSTIIIPNLNDGQTYRFDFITPTGTVYFWIDTKFYISSNNSIQLRDPSSPVNIIGFEPKLKLTPSGLVDKERSIQHWVDFIKYLPLLNTSTSSLFTSQSWQLKMEQLQATPGLDRLTPHMSTIEFTLIESADITAAGLALAKAINDACTFNESGAVGYSIYASESVIDAVSAALLYSKLSAANVANAFISAQNLMSSMIQDWVSQLSVSKSLTWDILNDQHVSQVQTSVFTSISSGNGNTESNGLSSVDILPQSYSVSKLETFSLISMSIGKFALANYAQIKIFKHFHERTVNQVKDDQSAAKVKNPSSNTLTKTIITRLGIGKWERFKSNKSRLSDINNQTGTISNNLASQTNQIDNNVGDVTDSILNAVSSLRGIN